MLLKLDKPVAQIHLFTYAYICFVWLKRKKGISYNLQSYNITPEEEFV